MSVKQCELCICKCKLNRNSLVLQWCLFKVVCNWALPLESINFALRVLGP